MQLHLIAQPQLPDLAGLPQWVQITVVLLLAVGWVGTQWARRRPPEVDAGEDDDASATRPLSPEGVTSALAAPAGDHQATAVIMRALELLHQEAEESREGRGDAARWRDKAAELSQRLAECEEQLDQSDGGSER